MKQFQLSLFDGHPIIKDGENIILVDTGAPMTIHTAAELTFLSDQYRCSTNYMGLTAAKISEMLGTEITTLLGADILSNYQLLLDYQQQVIAFAKAEIQLLGTTLPITQFMGIPIIELVIDQQKLKFFLDTGAKLSYLSARMTRNYESVGTAEDFYPGVGQFTTDCFEIPTRLGDHKFLVQYGNLPTLLQMTLTLGGTDGVIGFDFFNSFKLVLDLKNNSMCYTASAQRLDI